MKGKFVWKVSEKDFPFKIIMPDGITYVVSNKHILRHLQENYSLCVVFSEY